MQTVISYNFYYARPGNVDAVLSQRLLASDVRARLGLPRGRTISKVAAERDVPDVIWRQDFVDMPAQNADMNARAQSPDFEAIRHDMRKLYRRFERPLYAPCSHGDDRPLIVEQEQSLLLYGIYCNEDMSKVVRDVVAPLTASHGVQAAMLIAGGENVPRIICETGHAGMPRSGLAQLEHMSVRMEYSVWKIIDCG